MHLGEFKIMEILTQINETGLSKINLAKKDPFCFFIRSLLAGFYLGGAMILSYTLGALFQSNPALSKLLIASTFGIGLVAICFLKAELFTGNCLSTIIPVYDKKASFTDIIPAWILCILGNMIGIAFIGFLFIIAQQGSPLMETYLKPLVENKLTFTYLPLFIKAILCNFIVCIAAYAGLVLKNDTSRIILILFFVCAFVISGLEHSIANAGFFTMGFTQYGFALDWSMLFIHMLLSILGNIIGGSILLGLPVYLSLRNR